MAIATEVTIIARSIAFSSDLPRPPHCFPATPRCSFGSSTFLSKAALSKPTAGLGRFLGALMGARTALQIHEAGPHHSTALSLPALEKALTASTDEVSAEHKPGTGRPCKRGTGGRCNVVQSCRSDSVHTGRIPSPNSWLKARPAI